MEFKLSVNMGKSTPAQPAPSAPPPASATPAISPETFSTLVALAKGMPPMLSQAQVEGRIASLNNAGVGEGPGAPYQMLRSLARDADLVRLAIEGVKKAIRAQDWDLVTEDGGGPNPKAVALLEKPDGSSDWDVWACMALEEILVCDNLTLFPWWKGGRVERAEVIDGDTVRALPGLDGRLPAHPEAAFEQAGPKGVQRFTVETLWFLPQNRRAKTWRGYSVTEQVAGRAAVNLHKLLKDLARWLKGGVPPALVTVEGMQADQGIAWQKALDERARNPKFESTLQVLPGSKAVFFPPLRIDKEHEEILIRTIFNAFGVDPTGMVSQVNYSTADALQRWANLQGLYPHLYALRAVANRLLSYAGYANHRLEWKAQRDAEALAQRQAKREDFKVGLASWEALRKADGEPTEPQELEGEHFFVQGVMSAFDPFAEKQPPPPQLQNPPQDPAAPKEEPQPAPAGKEPPGNAPPQPPAPEAQKADRARWMTVVRKAAAAGKAPRPFRSDALSRAYKFRVERALASGAPAEGKWVAEAFAKARPGAAEAPRFEEDRRAGKAQAALHEATAAYLAEVVPALVAAAKDAYAKVAKGQFLSPVIPVPTKETWRAFLDALEAAYTAGLDASAEVVGAGTVGDAAAAYAKTRAGYLLGRSWSDELGEWVQIPDSPLRIAESLRVEIRDLMDMGIRDGWSLGDFTSELATRYPDSFPQDRALRVARTETGDAYNSGNLANQAAQGVEVVEVMDGHGAGSCDACDEVDGQIWTVSYAFQNTLEHPNCTRAFLPRPDLTSADADN